MEDPLYHVLLEGRRVGPYDRRTIIGMRIKKTLTGANLVIASDGREFTVRELVKMGAPDPALQPGLPRGRSLAPATHSAWLVEVAGRGIAIPAFKGEIELRVQTRVLRMAGRFREGLASREGRVKIALQDVLHARVRGSLVELGLRAGGGAPPQRVVLELFTPDDAAGFVEALPRVKPWPAEQEPTPPQGHGAARGPYSMVWAAVVGTVVVVGGVLVWVFTRR